MEASGAEKRTPRKGDPSAIAVHELSDPSLSSLYGIVELANDGRLTGMEEKPEHPRSNLASTATYLFSERHLALIDPYLEQGNPPDPPGRFLTWLCEREPVFGFRFDAPWLDIGNPAQLLEADNRYRIRAGLPPRAEYAPGPLGPPGRPISG